MAQLRCSINVQPNFSAICRRSSLSASKSRAGSWRLHVAGSSADAHSTTCKSQFTFGTPTDRIDDYRQDAITIDTGDAQTLAIQGCFEG